MSAEKSVKQQRDRFLAFAFASSDLLLEVDPEETILYSAGAARKLTGAEDLVGRCWLELFAKIDRPTLVSMRGKAKEGIRNGPLLVSLDGTPEEPGSQVVVTAIRMPDDPKLYVTLGFSNLLMAKAGKDNRSTQEGSLLDKDTFTLAAKEALNLAKTLGQDVDMTLLDIAGNPEARERMGEERWAEMSAAIGSFLRTKSVDGRTAAEISEGRYSVLHDTTIDSDILMQQVAEISKATDPENLGLDVQAKTVTADLQALSERETTKALIYTINEFERKGTNLTIETLNNGFQAYVSANAQKISQFKSMIDQLNFNLHFQPIVDLQTGEAAHYEMLTRFADGGSPYEWIIFGEDIGMAPDFDMAVCERAINYLVYQSGGTRTKFAVNLSGQSIQSEQFFKSLYGKLMAHKNLSSRLMFEITESTNIESLETVNHFIQMLQKEGFKVCLDDFGAGSASFQYLHKLHVDYVKIDGQYIKKLLTSDRDATLVRNLVRLCQDLKVNVVAEMVECQEEVDILKEMGVQYGQGYFFSKPMPKPEYAPAPKK